MAYKDLSLKERHAIIRAGVANGIHRLADIEARYNEFTSPESNPDYDMEGYIRENPSSLFSHDGHFPDKFKKPNHPTFSDESIYHSELTPGGHWSERNSLQRWNFSLSAQQISQPGYIQKVIDYFNNSESEGVTLTDSQGRYPSINGTIYGGVLPEVTVTPQYKEGGSIHIKHPGRLTALKERTSKTEAELWATGNAHTRKMITFARNARKWKHSTGGPLYPFSFSKQPLPLVRY